MLNQKKNLLQLLLPHIGAIILFIALTMIFFSPLFQGKALQQGDTTLFVGSSQELREYYNNEGESSAWTGTVFSGMPSYQIGVWGGSPQCLDYLEKPARGLMTDTAAPLFMGMLMAYILFCVVGFRPAISVTGAIAYAFSSYNLIIIVAGHMTKAWAIAYIPLIVAGLIVLFKRKYLLSGVLMALGLGLQLKNNHLQMTYYTAILCALIYITLVVDFIQKKEFKGLIKGTGILLIAVLLAVAANYSNIYNNYLMSEESIRGESELTQKGNNEIKKSSGLDKDYVFQWSYGKSETFSLLVPNIYGGVSKGFEKDSAPFNAVMKAYQSGQMSDKEAQMLMGYTTEYWGAQPFTSGPVYFGAIVCCLFILGMIIIKNRLKWTMLIATVLFIFLAWGKNLEWFNDFMFYHFPFYNKFRAVSSALVIPAFTMVFVAIWGLKEFFYGEIDKKKRLKALYISAGITGGLCLILWIAPGAFFNFTSPTDVQMGLTQIPDFYQAVMTERKNMLSTDASHSFIFVVLGTAILWFVARRKDANNETINIAAILFIAIFILVDLWMVDKRYLNESNFVNKKTQNTEAFRLTESDKFILDDKGLSHRVLKLGNPFNENMTSYYHKSIGGHSAAKLKRYQELIDYYLGADVQKITDVCGQQYNGIVAKAQQDQNITMRTVVDEMQYGVLPVLQQMPVINMLNTKYIIYHPELNPIVNPYAMGNAWFVKGYHLVNNADEEIAELGELHPAAYAIVDKRFEGQLTGLSIVPDSTASIEMTVYKPNKLVYKSKTLSEQLAVFSEIYFAQGWEAKIDGKPADYMRVDWTLRAMRIPAGEHEISFEFIPRAYNTSRMISTIFSAILIVVTLGGLGFLIFGKKKE